MQPKLTPLMQQYWEMKSAHADKIMLFRMGDFFEMFHQDAETAAPILNIALTQRNKKAQDATSMCGVPHHSIAGPIGKLLAAGYKVAICDQIEDPAQAKGIVKRAVTRVLTPGMVYDPSTLDELKAHYLASYDEENVAFADLTTGTAFRYQVVHEREREELLNLLNPVELVLSAAQINKRRQAGQVFSGMISAHEMDSAIERHRDPTTEPLAVQRLLSYMTAMQGQEAVSTLSPFEVRRFGGGLRISATTYSHLEVFSNMRGGREGTLCEAMDRTRTSSGARLLITWLLSPSCDRNVILARQGEVAAWMKDSGKLKEFRQRLSRLGDVERRLGKIHAAGFNARDLRAIGQSLATGLSLSEMDPMGPVVEESTRLSELSLRIEAQIVDDPPIAVKEGGLIRAGVYAELDELVKLSQNMNTLLVELEQREKEATGISSLKVRYNSVFGFYIEITKTHSDKAPDHYRRKQTLTNAERYTTDELSALEEKVLSARSKRDQMEYEIFSQLRQEVIHSSSAILQAARTWSHWDVTSALAWLALERDYVAPTFNEAAKLHYELARHPVLEQTLKGAFVANSVRLESGAAILLTGPNMAGKSTLMRQVALIALMAQVGSFVPCQSADQPLYDQIFTRVGASDALNEGKSTFMVEMSETADILKQATSRSLIIMDEIGRGTSTYDGLSLAQAILEHLLTNKKPHLLFATHYHELTKLVGEFPELSASHMSVQEKGGKIQFLHTLVAGAANQSYGVHVAKLAGLPASVTQRAQKLLNGFQSASETPLQLALQPLLEPSVAGEESAWLQELKNTDLTRLTPLEALNKLSEWQREASS
ncbi:MAG: DNA mismatch repair protein MutS [Bdellovibrionales bacterium]